MYFCGMPPIKPPKRVVNVKRIFLAGGTAAAVSALLCVFYKMVYEHYTGFRMEQFVNARNIVLACAGGSFLATLGYLVLSYMFDNPQWLFSFATFLLMLASLMQPMSNLLPDGTTAPHDFAWLTFPMHVFTGMIVMILIPLIAGKPKKVYDRR